MHIVLVVYIQPIFHAQSIVIFGSLLHLERANIMYAQPLLHVRITVILDKKSCIFYFQLLLIYIKMYTRAHQYICMYVY